MLTVIIAVIILLSVVFYTGCFGKIRDDKKKFICRKISQIINYFAVITLVFLMAFPILLMNDRTAIKRAQMHEIENIKIASTLNSALNYYAEISNKNIEYQNDVKSLFITIDAYPVLKNDKYIINLRNTYNKNISDIEEAKGKENDVAWLQWWVYFG